jgi:hypothetical protein
MLGSEPAGIATGEVIDADRLLAIDQALAAREAQFDMSSALLPNYSAISGPDFLDNIPQRFAVHQIVELFRLLNESGTAFQSYNNDCVLASFIPTMCGAMVDMGTTDGSSCKNFGVTMREEQIIQMPELFGFENVRTEISASELPNSNAIQSTCQYVDVLMHEFVHDIDQRYQNSTNQHKQYDRADSCSTHYMNFNLPGTPFVYSGENGGQNPDDYVSGYASGLTNASQDYRQWEEAAETVTTYVLFPEYFRSRAANSVALQAKYDYVRDNLFGGNEFENPAFSEEDPFEWYSNTNVLCREFGVTEFRLSDISVRTP